MSTDTPLTYKESGVDIDAKHAALTRARTAIRSTFTPGVVGDVGLFGGLFDPERAGCAGELLVASADGVGTKLEVAKRAGIYDTVGHDIVNHCINDVLVQGARPLFFLDYVGTGRLDPAVVSALIEGCAAACREHGVALLGGETAEMPGLYAPGDFDLVGFLVGAVPRARLLDGSRVREGQVLLGLASSGLHTNGYTLARRILFEELGLGLDARPAELGGRTVAEALLAPHQCYLEPLWPLLTANLVQAMAHITGGGFVENVPRVLGEHTAVLDRSAWQVPGLFRLLVKGGRLEASEAYRVFNMGIGMVLFVEPGDVGRARAALEAAGFPAPVIGRVERGRREVRFEA